ncbi:hypothetical protein OAA26_00230 [bacterium]|nr:hypothetical protein [bacterium]|tara:strand:- start:4630 stop:5754 length:1125 start_codon:yes stop_codon:yes gene_type:complete
MGSNLNQVFISNALTVIEGNQAQFGSLAGADPADDVGIFTLGTGTPAYTKTAIYQKKFAGVGTNVDTSDSGAADDPLEDLLTTVAPIWTVSGFQLTQRPLSGNIIASPIIDATRVKRINYNGHVAWAGHLATCVDATFDTASSVNADSYQFKFIIRTVPVNQTSYYNDGMGAVTGTSKVFPLGSFNTTNHKAVNMTVVIADHTDADAAQNITNATAAVAAHPLLKNMVSVADVGSNMVFTSLHPGLSFDLIVTNLDREDDGVAAATTGEVKGVGNDWQVADDEARCRYRQGSFNRMYFPQSVDTFVTAGHAYDKITIEYATPNWPNGAGIAPAGGSNIATIYYTNAGTDPGTTSTNEFADVFNFVENVDEQFIW